MPQRQLSPADWALVVRTISDVQHLLSVIGGGTLVEAGVAVEDADEHTATVLATSGEVQALERALRLLGFDPTADRMPPQIRDQLAGIFGYARTAPR